ncbi:hypothetical protein BH11PLA2_BH11PLA2_41740 [soil metagenome]
MAINPYDNCPCGSGKKFKWCCAPYYDQIELALQQEQQGQHDGALQTMEGLTKAHGDKPPVWGYFANVLFAEGKTEQAEEAIQKGFAIQPDWAMGHLLRGLFRQAEGEIIGSLLLFRKAADAYPAEAFPQLAQVYEMIARTETQLNHPVAARAAMEKVLQYAPSDPELTQQFEYIFGNEARLPLCSRKQYKFRPTGKSLPESAITGKFSDAKKAFESLTTQYPTDAAAWFNYGLVRAWLGENSHAVEALTKSLDLEVDDFRSEETAALVEVLKCGGTDQTETDFIEHRGVMQIRDGQAAMQLLQTWEQERRFLSPQVDEENGIFSAVMVEELPNLLDTGTSMGKVVANLMVGMGTLRLWHPVKANVEKLCVEVRDRLNMAISEPHYSTGPMNFADACIEALVYPLRAASMEEAEKKMGDAAARYFEDTWIHRNLKSLGGSTPIDAMGSTQLRKRVLGLVRFLQDCMDGASPRKKVGEDVVVVRFFDFDKLRRKLGIAMATADAPAVAQIASAPKRDFTAMSVADLGLQAKEDMSTSEFEDAMRAAIKLGANELAVEFARKAVAKPFDVDKPDRYPFFATLMTGAMSTGNTAEALKTLTEGAKYDATHNDGKRANEYGLRTAAFHAKLKDSDKAIAAFETVIDRNPDDGNLYVKAAETMLSIKDVKGAKLFAEKGIAKGKNLGNRDLQAACSELLEAAKKYE